MSSKRRNMQLPLFNHGEELAPPPRRHKHESPLRKRNSVDAIGWDTNTDEKKEELAVEEPEPDFGLSGALAAETNTVNGVVLLHNEPQEAHKPRQHWRLYVFKSGKPLDEPLLIYKKSCYLFGRERKAADIPIDHPSCSKQHAVIQYRLTKKKDADGLLNEAIRPYLMDLGSTNGTFVNGDRIESQKYYELLEKDLIKFGNSSREYILLQEK